MNNTRRHLGALLFMVLGSVLVFGGVLAMNLFSDPPSRNTLEQLTTFEVDKKPPPPRQRRERSSQVKRQAKSVARAPAIAPDISSQLSGVSFGLPQFESIDLSSAAAGSVLSNTAKEMVMTEDSVDKPAEPVRRVQAVYPDAARKKGIEGYVTLNLLVTADGGIGGVRILSADPPGIFEESAMQAIEQWEFRPAEYNGTPVSYRLKQTIRFKMQ